MGNKRYFWLKLSENFFDDDTIKFLEEQQNGSEYVLFYLKLALKSLKDDGILVRYIGQQMIPFDENSLAKLTNTPVDTVMVALNLFLKFGLIQRMDSGEIFMNQFQEMVGTETDSAIRMRKKRAKQEALKAVPKPKQIEGSHNVTEDAHNVQKSDTEKEKDLDLDSESEKDQEKEQSSVIQSFTFWERNGFGDLAHHTTERMYAWFGDFEAKGSTQEQSDQLMIEALKVAVEANARTWKFTEGVLRNWLNKGLITVEKMQAHEAQRAANKQYSNAKNNVRTETLPDWHNEENVGEEIDKVKQAEFAERLEKIRNRSN